MGITFDPAQAGGQDRSKQRARSPRAISTIGSLAVGMTRPDRSNDICGSAAGILCEAFSLYADYDGELRAELQAHTVIAGLRLTW